MKYESQYYEPLVVDEVWVRQGDELIRLEPVDGNGDSGKDIFKGFAFILCHL